MPRPYTVFLSPLASFVRYPPEPSPWLRAGSRVALLVLGLGVVAATGGCGRAPGPEGSPDAASPATAPGSPRLPGKAEIIGALNGRPGRASFMRAVDAQIEPAGAPEPGSGRQALGYRATYEVTEDVYTAVADEPTFARLRMDLPRWEAAGRLRRETLRPATLRAAKLEGDPPKNLVALHRVLPRGGRLTVWGRAAAVHVVDRWEILDISTGRIEPALPEVDIEPRGYHVAQHAGETVLAEDEDAALRRWAQEWDDYSARVEAAVASQKTADEAQVARYRQNPGDYLLSRRWSVGGVYWIVETGQSRVYPGGVLGRFTTSPRTLTLGSGPYATVYDWRQEADGTVFFRHPDAPRGFRLSEVRAVGDHQIALIEPLQPGSLSPESNALVEEAPAAESDGSRR